jgi:hypothetical protein
MSCSEQTRNTTAYAVCYPDQTPSKDERKTLVWTLLFDRYIGSKESTQ